jgi:hypothetical protein
MLITYDILVLGPESGREEIVEPLETLGHTVTGAGFDWASPPHLDERFDVVVLDARDGQPDWATPHGPPWLEGRPLLVVADRPGGLLGPLRALPGGFALLSGPQTPAGYQVALCLCTGLNVVETGPTAW